MNARRLSEKDAAEVSRILDGLHDPDYLDDDPAAYDPPKPISAASQLVVDGILKREGHA